METLPKVCRSEGSEQSAVVPRGLELRILRFAEDDSDFHRDGGPHAPEHSQWQVLFSEKVLEGLARVQRLGS